MKSISQLQVDLSQIRQLSIDSADVINEIKISDPPQPQQFANSKLQLPKEIGTYNLKKCFESKWIRNITNKINQKLFDAGRSKSLLKLTIKNLTDCFHDEIKRRKLDTAIQIEIDRNSKIITAELDENKLKGKLIEIHKSVYSEAKEKRALYPIFISSVRRKLKDETDFKPNLILINLVLRIQMIVL